MKQTNVHSALSIIVMTGILTMMINEAFALPDDRNQPIEVEANSAERDAKTGITTYTGNVDIRQGSIHISGASVVLKTDKNDELTSIIATGGPAHYEQNISGADDLVKAVGNKINYQVQKDLIILEQNASVEQKGSVIKGEHIEYDVKSETVRAQGSQKGSSDNSKRISVTIPPSKKKSTQKTSSTTKTENATMDAAQ
jgi:lipopolysaccharide export system protein LptA